MCFKMIPFSIPLLAARGFFSYIHSEDLVELLEENSHSVGWPLWLAPPGVINFAICPHWAFSNSSTTDQVFLLWLCFLWWFLPMDVAWGMLWFYFLVCLSNFGDSGLPCDLISLVDLRTVNFSVCSAFYLLEQSGDFKFLLHWTENWKSSLL